MAKRGVLTHRKTRHLARILGVPLPFALGVLESLWHAAAQSAPRGDIGKLTDQELADSMWWEGDAVQVVEALVDSKWLSTDSHHRLLVVGWSEHADDAVRKGLSRRGETFADGRAAYLPKGETLPDSSRCDAPDHPVGGSSPADVETEPAAVETCLDISRHDPPTRASSGASASTSASSPLSANADIPPEGEPEEAKRGKRGGIDPPPPELAELPGFLAAWADWLAYRKEKRLGIYKPLGLAKAYKDLLTMPDPVGAIEHSMRKGYQGIFPPKAGGGGGSSGPKSIADRRAELAAEREARARAVPT